MNNESTNSRTAETVESRMLSYALLLYCAVMFTCIGTVIYGLFVLFQFFAGVATLSFNRFGAMQ
jgi:hypothetical protein